MFSKQSKILLALRVLTILTCIVGVTGLAWSSTKEHGISTDGLGVAFDQLGAIALGISGLWSIIALFVTLLFHDPMHPGIIIGLDTTMSALTLAVGIAIACSHVSGVDDLTCREGRFSFCDPTEDRTIIFRIIGTAFCLFNFVCHTIFVICASVTCHKRRKGVDNSDIMLKA